LLAADEELQAALQHVGHLLALVPVQRHERATLEIDLRQHLALAGDDLPRDRLSDLLERDLVPAVQAQRGPAHRPDPVADGGDACTVAMPAATAESRYAETSSSVTRP